MSSPQWRMTPNNPNYVSNGTEWPVVLYNIFQMNF